METCFICQARVPMAQLESHVNDCLDRQAREEQGAQARQAASYAQHHMADCPICGVAFPDNLLEAHASECFGAQMTPDTGPAAGAAAPLAAQPHTRPPPSYDDDYVVEPLARPAPAPVPLPHFTAQYQPSPLPTPAQPQQSPQQQQRPMTAASAPTPSAHAGAQSNPPAMPAPYARPPPAAAAGFVAAVAAASGRAGASTGGPAAGHEQDQARGASAPTEPDEVIGNLEEVEPCPYCHKPFDLSALPDHAEDCRKLHSLAPPKTAAATQKQGGASPALARSTGAAASAVTTPGPPAANSGNGDTLRRRDGAAASRPSIEELQNIPASVVGNPILGTPSFQSPPWQPQAQPPQQPWQPQPQPQQPWLPQSPQQQQQQPQQLWQSPYTPYPQPFAANSGASATTQAAADPAPWYPPSSGLGGWMPAQQPQLPHPPYSDGHNPFAAPPLDVPSFSLGNGPRPGPADAASPFAYPQQASHYGGATAAPAGSLSPWPSTNPFADSHVVAPAPGSPSTPSLRFPGPAAAKSATPAAFPGHHVGHHGVDPEANGDGAAEPLTVYPSLADLHKTWKPAAASLAVGTAGGLTVPGAAAPSSGPSSPGSTLTWAATFSDGGTSGPPSPFTPAQGAAPGPQAGDGHPEPREVAADPASKAKNTGAMAAAAAFAAAAAAVVQAKKPELVRAQALYDFVGSREDELSFSKGDLLLIEGSQTNGWMRGTVRHDRTVWGMIPYNYVTMLGEDAKLPEPAAETVQPDLQRSASTSSMATGSVAATTTTSDDLNAGPMTEARALGPVWGDQDYTQIWKDHVSKLASDGIDPRERKRQVAIVEMLETWRVLTGELQNLINTVVIPLRKNGLVTVEMGLDIFANVEELLQAARSLFEGLEKRVTDERYMVRNLADVLLDRIRGLQVCAAYSSNLGRASRKLTEYAKENKAFQMFLTERNWTIMKMEGFLVKPIQRVLKLDLQVKAVVEATDTKHPDYWPLKEAQAMVVDLSTFINLVNGATQDLENLKQQSEKVVLHDPSFAAPSRRQLVYGSPAVLRKENGEEKHVLILLFRDCILLMRPKPTGTVRSKGLFSFTSKSRVLASAGGKDMMYRLYTRPLFLETVTFRDAGVGILELEDASTHLRFRLHVVDQQRKVRWLSQLQAVKDDVEARRIVGLVRTVAAPFPGRGPVTDCIAVPGPSGAPIYLVGTEHGMLYATAASTGAPALVPPSTEGGWAAVLGPRRRIKQMAWVPRMQQILVAQRDLEGDNAAAFAVTAYGVAGLVPGAAGEAGGSLILPNTKHATFVRAVVADASTDTDLSTAAAATPDTSADVVVGLPDHVACFRGAGDGGWRETERWAAKQSTGAAVVGNVAIVCMPRRLLLRTDPRQAMAPAAFADTPAESQPLTLVRFANTALLLAYDLYGQRLTPAGERAPGCTPVFWTAPATSVCTLGDLLFVAVGNAIEVRHIDRLWELLQLLPCAGPANVFAGGLVVTAAVEDGAAPAAVAGAADAAAPLALYSLRPLAAAGPLEPAE